MNELRIRAKDFSLRIYLKTMKLSMYKERNNLYEAFLPKILNLNQIKPFKLKYVQSETICIKLGKRKLYYKMFMATHICTKNI